MRTARVLARIFGAVVIVAVAYAALSAVAFVIMHH